MCVRNTNRNSTFPLALGNVTSAMGLIGLAFISQLFADPLTGILLCVSVYAVGSGLIEVLCSPIIEACPFPNKESIMSLLHSFYCWGAVGVILGSTLFFTCFGLANWKVLACLWALVPLFGPSLVGLCTRSAGSDIQSGLLAASVFPVILVACIKGITRERAKSA